MDVLQNRVTYITDLVMGTDKGGRVTKWTYVCECSPGQQLTKPTSKANAKLDMLDHMRMHRGQPRLEL